MIKTKQKQKVVVQTEVDTTVIDDIKTHVRAWHRYETERKRLASEASTSKKLADSELSKAEQLYKDNGIKETIKVDSTIDGNRKTLTLGEQKANNTTTVNGDLLWEKYEDGTMSKEEMKTLFIALSSGSGAKGVYEKVLGGAAKAYFTVVTDNTKFGIK